MKVYTELLRRRYSSNFDDTANQYLDYIESGAGRMSSLIRDLLSYSRMTMADESRQHVTVDMNAAVQTALDQLRAAIDRSGARITVEPLPQAHGNFDHLVTVFQNLVTNSLKYTKAGERPEIRISGTEDGGTRTFAVQDRGQGIAPQYHQQIFGVFKRLHGSKIEGTGIGLSLCQRLIEEHGGRIWVESQAGEGATFLFTIPAPL